jgi:DNA-binding MarR family transcriptional regulator
MSDAIRQVFEEKSLGVPENAVGFVIWRIAAGYQREVDRALASGNLTNLQFITLALVAWFGREDTPVTQIELARSARIHPMQVSQTLKALEAKGMVTRRQSKSDTRAKRVEITKPGLKALSDAFPKVREVQMRLFGAAGLPGGSLLGELLRVDADLIGMNP